LKQRSKKGNRRIGARLLPWMFVLPSFSGLLLFKYYPLMRSLFMGLFDWNILEPPGVFVGLRNYARMFFSSFFLDSLWNTVVIWLMSMLFAFWVPVVQAVFLNEIRGKSQGVFKVLYLVPMVVPGVSSILLWKWIYNPEYGLANQLLGALGLPGLMWLNDISTAKLALTLPGLIGGSTAVIIYLATIQGIPQEMYEAASLDGANFLQRALRLTLPNMKGIIEIQLVLSLSTALQLFDGPYMMTGGGPAGSTTTLAIRIYNLAFSDNDFGMASAMAAFIFTVTILLVGAQLMLRRRHDEA